MTNFVSANGQEINFREATDLELRGLRGIVYLFYNKLNRKIYVGKTIRSFYERYSLDYSKWFKRVSNEHFRNALLKYKRLNWIIMIIKNNLNKDVLSILEVENIKKFESDNQKYGYNKTKGGEGSTYTNEEINRLFQDFLNKANKKFNNEYEYNRNEFIKLSSKITIKHKICGFLFKQSPFQHFKVTYPCPKCNNWNCNDKNMEFYADKRFEDFLHKAQLIHESKYDYSQINYKNSQEKLNIICKICGLVFYQSRNEHLRGHGCPYCGRRKVEVGVSVSFDEFLKRSYDKFGQRFKYNVIINPFRITNDIEIIDTKCGFKFIQNAFVHLQGEGGCPKCKIENIKRRNSIKVAKLDPKNLEIIKLFPSSLEAERQTKIYNIRLACRKNLIRGGFRWKYIEN